MLGQGAYFAWAASYSLEGYSRRVRLCPRNVCIRIMTDGWHALSQKMLCDGPCTSWWTREDVVRGTSSRRCACCRVAPEGMLHLSRAAPFESCTCRELHLPLEADSPGAISPQGMSAFWSSAPPLLAQTHLTSAPKTVPLLPESLGECGSPKPDMRFAETVSRSGDIPVHAVGANWRHRRSPPAAGTLWLSNTSALYQRVWTLAGHAVAINMFETARLCVQWVLPAASQEEASSWNQLVGKHAC